MKNKEFDISGFTGIMVIISIVFTIILIIASLGYEDKPKYDKNGVQVYYINDSDNIRVVNNSNSIAYITIGNNIYSVSNTNGNKVTLGLNSGYGKIDININGDILTIHREYEYED